MAHIPPSAPRLLRLAHPRAVCHTNSILYESGVDISPPGETDGTFHYTSKQLLKPVRQNTAENRSVWKPSGSRQEWKAYWFWFFILSIIHYAAVLPLFILCLDNDLRRAISSPLALKSLHIIAGCFLGQDIRVCIESFSWEMEPWNSLKLQ